MLAYLERIAAANIEQAAGVLTTTRAPLFPQVGYSGTAARQRLSSASRCGGAWGRAYRA